MAKWTLRYGIHKGTRETRESFNPKEFDDEQKAMKYYREYRKFWRGIGYKIWYARLMSPDGEEEVLESNSYK